MALLTVKALDHFSSSDKNGNNLVLEFIGRFIELNEHYIKLESIIPVDDGSDRMFIDGKIEYRFVLKKVVVGKPKLYLEQDDDVDEITKTAEKLNAEIIGVN